MGSSRPQLKAPAGLTRWCLGIYSVSTDGATDATNYYPKVSWSGYAAAGSYTGVGTGAGAAAEGLVDGMADGQLPAKR